MIYFFEKLSIDSDYDSINIKKLSSEIFKTLYNKYNELKNEYKEIIFSDGFIEYLVTIFIKKNNFNLEKVYKDKYYNLYYKDFYDKVYNSIYNDVLSETKQEIFKIYEPTLKLLDDKYKEEKSNLLDQLKTIIDTQVNQKLDSIIEKKFFEEYIEIIKKDIFNDQKKEISVKLKHLYNTKEIYEYVISYLNSNRNKFDKNNIYKFIIDGNIIYNIYNKNNLVIKNIFLNKEADGIYDIDDYVFDEFINNSDALAAYSRDYNVILLKDTISILDNISFEDYYSKKFNSFNVNFLHEITHFLDNENDYYKYKNYFSYDSLVGLIRFNNSEESNYIKENIPELPLFLYILYNDTEINAYKTSLYNKKSLDNLSTSIKKKLIDSFYKIKDIDNINYIIFIKKLLTYFDKKYEKISNNKFKKWLLNNSKKRLQKLHIFVS